MDWHSDGMDLLDKEARRPYHTMSTDGHRKVRSEYRPWCR